MKVTMRGVSGPLLIGIGVLHTVVGVFNGYSVLSQISRAAFSTEPAGSLSLLSGFWLVLVVAIYIIVIARPSRRVAGTVT